MTIAGGDKVTSNLAHAVRVPKRDFVNALLLSMWAGSLAIAQNLEHAPPSPVSWRRCVTISNAGHDSYGVWRYGEHDNLVLALALAVWTGERTPSRLKPGKRVPLNP